MDTIGFCLEKQFTACYAVTSSSCIASSAELLLFTNYVISYTTLRVWYRSYCMSMRQKLACTMPKRLFQGPALFCKTRLIYSIRAVCRSIQLTVLEYIDPCYSNKLILCPMQPFMFYISIPSITLIAEDMNLGMVVWHCPTLCYKGSGAASLA